MGSGSLQVLLLSRFSRPGPSSRIRFYQYLPHLARHRIEVTVSALLDANYTRDLFSGKRQRLDRIALAYVRRLMELVQGRRFDLVWLEAELWPRLPAWGESLLSRLGLPYVVDYDDSIFHRYDLHPNPAVRALLSHKIDAVMRHAALVLVGSQYLADRAEGAGARRIEYLPSVVDLDRYSVTQPADDKVVTIGWIGSPTSAAYIPAILPALEAASKKLPLRFVFVGSGPTRLGDLPAEVREWTEDTEVEEIQRFDIGIMPLPDNPITRGKSGYKIVQYLACGRPAVASPVGANSTIVSHGVDGFLARDGEQWIDSLSRLALDAGLRRSMGEAGRAKVAAHYSVQVTVPRLAEMMWQSARGSG
jgi:glycosyltransferase involved in cell wall biosynthesis